jgi:fumarate reductase flavoprotein subunit
MKDPKKAELVVIGGGGSGLAAALSAAEKGINNIVLLEKSGRPGGFTAMAHGFFACESPVQQREMIDCRADDCFKILMNWSHWSRVDPLVVRAFFNKSGDTVRWLESKGLEFILRRTYPNQMPVWHNPKGLGAHLVKVLTRECEERGISILTHTSGKKLLTDNKGAISGILAITAKGEELEIEAKSVIIATGGIGGNLDLLKKYCQGYYDGMPIPPITAHHTGDGLIMAGEIGASIANSIPILVVGHGPDIPHHKGGNVPAVTGEPYTLWINKNGQRFADESAIMAENAALMQPEKISFCLIDDETRQYVEEKGVLIGRAPPEVEYEQRRHLPGFKEELQKHDKDSSENAVKIADTWEEIAVWIGAAPETLKKTISDYNAFCDQGHDAVFAKDRQFLRPLSRPPFYAIRCCPGFHDTMGGIKVTQNMEVRDKNDRLIPGLYSAGAITDGWESDIYCWILCGAAFGFALNSGRIAGESAAQFVNEIKN